MSFLVPDIGCVLVLEPIDRPRWDGSIGKKRSRGADGKLACARNS